MPSCRRRSGSTSLRTTRPSSTASHGILPSGPAVLRIHRQPQPSATTPPIYRSCSDGTQAATGWRTARGPQIRRHEELANLVHVGPADDLGVDAVLDLIRSDPSWPEQARSQKRSLVGAVAILRWLEGIPGGGWQARWGAATDGDPHRWVERVCRSGVIVDGLVAQRKEARAGMRALIASRVLLPSYACIPAIAVGNLFSFIMKFRGAAEFAEMDGIADRLRINHDQYRHARSLLTRITIHTGRDLHQLAAEDLFEYRASYIARFGSTPPGVHAAWDLLRELSVLPPGSTLIEQLRRGPKTTTELVDGYPLRCAPIREVLIRYLSERRPAQDYSTFKSLVYTLVARFWGDLETHHPGIDSLHLPTKVAQAWKERLAASAERAPTAGAEENIVSILSRVRAFYLDVQEWAATDPSWAPWAVPSPVRRTELTRRKARRATRTARIHQRIRERLPHLPDLVTVAETRRASTAEFLELASAVPISSTFTHEGVEYRRLTLLVPESSRRRTGRGSVVLLNTRTEERLDLTTQEDHAFWAWAVIETLRHSGLRVEELTELTQLAVTSHTLPGEAGIVPLLQVVPSKSDEERLLLVSPEMASVLASIISRLRARNDGAVPLVRRYDVGEGVLGPALPHLFQRRRGYQPTVMSAAFVRTLIAQTIEHTGLRDTDGQPLRFTPHDFRRMFATEAVGSGLPVHIVAKLLGHQSINTTQGYVAVFQDDLIRTYRGFLDQRRALRPPAEYREPTDQEWRDFQQHFELRKVALGTCARPYATPCQHEHACVRCAVLHVDPKQRDRLVEIVANLRQRIDEAHHHRWAGEARGLEVSLAAAEAKITALDRTNARKVTQASLGFPRVSGRVFGG